MVLDSSNDRVIAYNAATRLRDSDKDINLSSDGRWRTAVYHDDTIWFVNLEVIEAVRLYKQSAIAYNTQVFPKISDVINIGSFQSKAITAKVIDNETSVYDSIETEWRSLSLAQIVKTPSKDFTLGDGRWQGAFASGNHVWVIDNSSSPKLVGYTHSNATFTRNSAADLDLDEGSWSGGFSIGNTIAY